MKIIVLFIFLILQCDDTISDTDVIEESPKPKKTNILFIGNSLTFFNLGVDSLLKRIIETEINSDTAYHIIEDMAYGGWTLKRHWENPETKVKIKANDWDIIVLQESGQLIHLGIDETLPVL